MCVECVHVVAAAVPAVGVVASTLRIRPAYVLLGKTLVIGGGHHYVVNGVTGAFRATATLTYVGPRAGAETPERVLKVKVGLLLDALAAGLIEEV